MTKLSRGILAVGLALIVFSTSCSFAFLKPRPYGIQETDLENAYYYEGLLIARGEEPSYNPHPGTPIQYLMGLVIHWVGDDIRQTQEVLNVGYILVGLFNAAAIALFVLFLPSAVSVAAALLAATTIIIFPSFLSHLNYVGGDSFILVPTLPAIVLLWSGILGHRRLTMSLLIVAGALLGLGSAIKLTVAPMALAFFLATLPVLYQDIRRKKSPWYIVIVLPYVIVLSFVLFALPSAQYYPQLVHNVAAVTKNSLPFFITITGTLLFLTQYAMPFMILLGLALCIPVATGIATVRRSSFRSVVWNMRWGPAALYTLLCGVFLLAAHSVVLDPLYGDIGVVLRYMTPAYLIVPLALLVIFPHPHKGQNPSRVDYLAILLSVIVLITATTSYANVRAYSIAWRTEIAQFLEEKIAEHAHPSSGRAAIWSSGPNNDGAVFPEALFHFFGNYKFGNNRFDNEISDAFPTVTYFNERVARGKISGSKKDAHLEVVMGERTGVRPSLFFFPENEVSITDYVTVPPAVQTFFASDILLSEHYTHPQVQEFISMLQRKDLGKVLAFLSDRYDQPFVASRVNMLGHPWIMLKP